jgi:ubiquinone/menaquinone biosynthesis C-methylase UbiE
MPIRNLEHVGEVFHSVAEEYDLMNDAMSFGMHRAMEKNSN